MADTSTKAGLAVLAFACALAPAACSNAPNVACPTTDVPAAADVATATRAVEVASATVGMADVPTETAERSYQEGARAFSLDQRGGNWSLTQVSRSELVDFVDISPAVAALEDEGFGQKENAGAGTSPYTLDSAYTLERGAQRATVSLGPRLRVNNGKVWAKVQVDTGCRST